MSQHDLYFTRLSSGEKIGYAESVSSFKKAIHVLTGQQVEIIGCRAKLGGLAGAGSSSAFQVNKEESCLLVLFLGSPNQDDIRLVNRSDLKID